MTNVAPKYLQQRGVRVARVARGCWSLEVNGRRYSDMCSKRDAVEIGKSLAGLGGTASSVETYETCDFSYNELRRLGQ